jgi:hypothetical protein
MNPSPPLLLTEQTPPDADETLLQVRAGDAAADGPPLAEARLVTAIGLKVPRFWFHVGCTVHASDSLGLFQRHRTLLLGNDHSGASELVLRPGAGGAPGGAALQGGYRPACEQGHQPLPVCGRSPQASVDTATEASRPLRQQQGAGIGETHIPERSQGRTPTGFQQPGAAPASPYLQNALNLRIVPETHQITAALLVALRKPAPLAEHLLGHQQLPALGFDPLTQTIQPGGRTLEAAGGVERHQTAAGPQRRRKVDGPGGKTPASACGASAQRPRPRGQQ